MVDSIVGWLVRVVMIVLTIALLWWGVTHAATVASIVVTIVNGFKAFFTTIFNGVF